jgi:predicted hydrocarbon binding protein
MIRLAGVIIWAMSQPTVDALLPFSLLEAVRAVDTPRADDAEYVPELRNKRLGLSETVYQQLRRYSDAIKRNQRTPQDEAVGIARLIGRRPDAESIFREAGQLTARRAYATLSPVSRSLLKFMPGIISRPIALRHARRLTERYMNGELARLGSAILLDVPRSVTVDSAPRQLGCTYYEAGLRELLTLLVGGTGAVDHVHCTARGDSSCSWRAEWRARSR